ncbi:peptide ABC transporter substrate-binding protein [Anaeromicropila herbilytica]|uniref:Peptide ABC transporter substrate-binding protein n=1 Tax=Anaeromicropila herbilytica TaxID=2785025 RepID=A0A7R7EMZ0_9FIRM|nr:peptide ABC transporter substrate-binding protein [Anaeromicropila herbilytica]BCN31794.1 peptide ABC transporter substrate-binding protein [Anaeromicropila herbilytica]
MSLETKSMKKLSIFMMLVFTILSLVGCGSSGTKDAISSSKAADEGEKVSYDKDQTLRTILFSPLSWDSTQCYDTSTSTVLSAVDAGLYRVYNDGKNGEKSVPDGAESYELSKDGLVYTFHLRSNNKWSDGVAVTAQNYADAIVRLLTPKNACPYAFFGFGIKNGEEYYNGTAKKEDLGVKVVNDTTLEITLDEPDPIFLNKISYQCFMPIRSDIIDKTGDKYGTDLSSQVFSGPFKVKVDEYVKDSKLVLVKNENYWDAANVHLERIEMTDIEEFSTQAQLFESKQLDITGSLNDYVAKWTKEAKQGAFRSDISNGTGMSYWAFNRKTGGTSGLMNNAKIRLALSLAYDREGYCNDLVKRYTPAYGIVPLVIHNGKDIYRDKVVEPLKAAKEKYNTKEKLQALFHEGLKEEGKDVDDLSKIKIEFISYGTDAASISYFDWYKQTIEKALGITLKVTALGDYYAYSDAKAAYKYDIYSSAWYADYDDPLTYLDVFQTDGGNNSMKYSNTEVDGLLKRLKGLTDQSERLKIYTQIEQILTVDDPAIIPYAYSDVRRFTHNYVKGFQTPSFGPTYEFKWAYISGK